jgi:hypothetical protein
MKRFIQFSRASLIRKARNGKMLNFRPSCRELCFVAEAFGICRFYVQFKAGRGGREAELLMPGR